jgi:hypothetical protein
LRRKKRNSNKLIGVVAKTVTTGTPLAETGHLKKGNASASEVVA